MQLTLRVSQLPGLKCIADLSLASITIFPWSLKSPEGGSTQQECQSVSARVLFFLIIFVYDLGRENQVLTAIAVLKEGQTSLPREF